MMNFSFWWWCSFDVCWLFQEQICIRQVTFDIEHYMEETIRGRAKWGDRYIAFTNYDLQILDVGFQGS